MLACSPSAWDGKEAAVTSFCLHSAWDLQVRGCVGGKDASQGAGE